MHTPRLDILVFLIQAGKRATSENAVMAKKKDENQSSDKNSSGKSAKGKGKGKGKGNSDEKETKAKGAQSINVRHILVSWLVLRP